MTNARKIWLTRHGESVYNQKALIGGDSPLSVNGRAYADVLPEVIMSRLPKVKHNSSLQSLPQLQVQWSAGVACQHHVHVLQWPTCDRSH